MTKPIRLVALDTETTGFNKTRGDNGALIAVGHRIIEIGCAEIIDGVVTGRTFRRFVNPHRKIDKAAIKVHGITDDQLKDKPDFEDVVGDLLDFIQGSDLIIHNAPFDTAFLDKEFKLLPLTKQPRQAFGIVDTLKIAREMFPGQRNTLLALCQRFNVSHAVEHSAILDAIMLANVYIHLLQV